MCIFPNPSKGAWCDARSIFKWSLTYLNSDFSSPRPVAILKLKNNATLLFIQIRRENSWIHTFPKGICALWNANSLVQVLKSVPTTETITSRTLPTYTPIYMYIYACLCVYIYIYMCVCAYMYIYIYMCVCVCVCVYVRVCNVSNLLFRQVWLNHG